MIAQAQSEQISIIGASNYYDFSVYEPFAQQAKAAGIQPLFGMEIVCRIEKLAQDGVKINDPGNPGKMYLCGKALRHYAAPNARAQELLDKIRSGDEQRIAKMVALLHSLFAGAGIPSPANSRSIVEQVALRVHVPVETVVLQERHVAQAFQEAIFVAVASEQRAQAMEQLFGSTPKANPDDAVGVQGEIRSHLMKAGKPAFVDEEFVSFEEAKELIEELGGIPCYPVLADGMSPMSEFESDPNRLADNLAGMGISAAEFIPNRNKASVVTEYVDALVNRGFLLSAGTEHNTQERIPLTPSCKGGEAIPADALLEFVKGAQAQVDHLRDGAAA